MKIFISQPMRGLSQKEILKKRERLKKIIIEEINRPLIVPYKEEEFEFINSFVTEEPPEDVKNKPAWYLAKSIEKLSEADIAVFDSESDYNRGCLIEHIVSAVYGVQQVIYLK